MLLIDKLGRAIRPGCWVIYGHALDRSAGLRIGKVLKVEGNHNNETLPWMRKHRITVWGIDDDHLSYSHYNPKEDWARPKALSKPSTLYFPERCIVVDEKNVPGPLVALIRSSHPFNNKGASYGVCQTCFSNILDHVTVLLKDKSIVRIKI